MDYLLFRLYGPLASWGEIAVGESRHSAVYPGKSALLGLLAAAIGIRRNEEERLAQLAAGYRFAVKVISSGHPLRDYHTTQAPDSVGKFVYRTRRDELITGKNRLGTILSSREYRCDALSLIAVAAMADAPFNLVQLRDALLKPRFHLYLGRKSCPLAAPLNPHICTAKGFGEALDNYRHAALFISNRALRAARNEIGSLADAPGLMKLSKEDNSVFAYDKQPARYYWEGDGGDLIAQQSLVRHDQPLSRNRWQFTQRTEHLTFGKEG
ncbi:type I-E CRISPR-associated protein Cas5/CasD [Geoalkalibacter halelectricus]|uniref:type I-E CRISPR-associated protein Cas5/CasD n=1 Tax=Geoalkalibacter halelectricus TaxID=2847045 RepID=UPI003D202C96